MPGTAVDVGTGTTLSAFGYAGQLLSVSWSGISRPSIETSHMGTAAPAADKMGNATFIPGDIVDPGELSCEFNFDPDKNVPIHCAAGTINVSFPLVAGGSSRAKWSASGFITGFEVNDPLEDKMTCTMTIKLTGNVTYTDAG